ncbi:MAG: acetate kinase [Thermodesulfobacteriota bacterium]|nr:acetate kinase [Thermodesulfobacteriota bacterium]
MKILVINTGSSSIKYQLFDMERQRVLAAGVVERIGEAQSILTHNKILENGENLKRVGEGVINNHHEGLDRIVDLLTDARYGVLQSKSEISAVGHRVVHGGETFHSPTIIDEKVIAAIRENIPLAPLHNPPNLTGIEVAKAVFPDSPQVAVFDTAFHQTIPTKAFLYALPYELYKKDKVRRYGFHGTSHSYVAQRAADYLGQPLNRLNLITIHLGNGASMAALKNGRCIDTTMGMTPLEGLVMGTRCGDVDPALPFFLADHLKMSLREIDTLLNKESGLKGICGTNDMREVMEKKNAGDPLSKIAIEIYCYRIKKYIGAYFAVLESLDGLIFTAGIGENSPEIRKLCCHGLSKLGIKLDPDRNSETEKEISQINSPESDVKILIIPTNEELKIAGETKKVIDSQNLKLRTINNFGELL